MPEFVRFPAANFSKLSPHHKLPSLSHPRMCYNDFKYLHAEREHEADKFYFTKIITIFKITVIIIHFILLRSFHSVSKEINKVFIAL